MKKYISIILIVSFSVMTVACAGVQVPIKTASDLRNVKPNDDYMRAYQIKFVSGEAYTVDDEDVDVRSGAIGIRFDDDQDFRYYAPDQIQSIERKIKTRTGMGALIGLGAGTAVGVTLGVIGAKGVGCEKQGDPGDCRGISVIVGIATGVGSVLLGTGIGAAVGAGIKRKKKTDVKVVVSPQFYGRDGVKINGGGLGIIGSF